MGFRRQLSDYEDVDHPSVDENCAQCNVHLYPGETDLCERCKDDYYRETAADDASEDSRVKGDAA